MNEDAGPAFDEAQDAIDEVLRVYEAKTFDADARVRLGRDLEAVLSYYFGESADIGAKVVVKGRMLRATLIKPQST